jgi:hypothetical protein
MNNTKPINPFKVVSILDHTTHTLDGVKVHIYENVIPLFYRKACHGVFLEGPKKGQDVTVNKQYPGLVKL